MNKVGQLLDGTLLGEKDGALYKGTPKQIPFNTLDFQEQDGIGTYSYQGEVMAKGSIGEPSPNDEKCVRLITVVDWVAT